MKRKNIQNTNGISVCDSIVMSVKNKRPNMRKPFSAAIAVIGFASVILSFLGMFQINYDHGKIFFASCALALFYVVVTVLEGKAFWLFVASLFAYIIAAYKNVSKIVLGFKFVYNIIYSRSFHTEILYYKGLKPSLEVDSVTTMMFFYIWLLAIVLFFFTICRPNPILPLLVSFPVIEIGLYNGIPLPVIRGMFVIAYWMALLGMCTIDIGEYSGGQSGFVRKNNLFFPKRHMKLKVTEKCGAIIMASVILITFIATGFLKVIDYKRSDEINKKRKDLSEAANSFSMDNVAESLANLMSAVGFDIKYENHKLGTNDHITYKNVTDLEINISAKPETALYLRDFAGCDYHDNEWFDLPDGSYDDPRYSDCSAYGINPQDFPAMFAPVVSSAPPQSIVVKSLLKRKRIFAPYCCANSEDFGYEDDTMLLPKEQNTKIMNYDFYPMTAENSVMEHMRSSFGQLVRGSYLTSMIQDPTAAGKIYDYCSSHGNFSYGDNDTFTLDHEIVAPDDLLYSNGNILLAELLENNYKSFVYDNYLRVPDTEAMREVRNAYSDVLNGAPVGTYSDRIAVLQAIRERIVSEAQYSLHPGKTPSNRDFVNYFLLENHKGYCIHYATAGVMLARMAGIPARYATGYVVVGDDFTEEAHNDDGTYSIDVKDNRSHAWAEVYIDGIGWLPFEFTAGYSDTSVQPEAPSQETTTVDPSQTTTGTGDTGSTTKGHHGTKNKTSITTAARTTTTNSVTSKSIGGLIGKGGNGKVSKILVNILRFVLLILVSVGVLFARRFLILKFREKGFTSGKNKEKIRNIYSYAEKLMAEFDITPENGKFTEFAKEAEDRLSGRYFAPGAFEAMTQTALRSGFSKTAPSNEEIKSSIETVRKIADTLYKNKNFIGKLYMKFVNVLI